MTRKELKAVYEKFENENPEFKGISQEAFGDAPWEGYVSLDELKERASAAANARIAKGVDSKQSLRLSLDKKMR